ncbi:MAG: helicase [Chloroflexi bacterium]|nr:helicase [Chloroflexota bacterium]
MTTSSKPEFVDNREGNTLAEALKAHLEWLGSTYVTPTELSIATGYFNPEGYFLIADQLENLQKVRLLLGAEPTPPHLRLQRKPGDLRGEAFNARAVDEALRALSEGLAHDRDLLGFSLEIDTNLQKLIDFLGTDRIEVKRYGKGFLHGKAFVFAEDEGLLSGSSNFTAAGLTTNMELNLGRYDPTPVRQVKQWFDDLWEESEAFDLAAIYDVRYQDYDPYLIYLRVLWELYKDELQQEQTASGRIPLTNFQNDGVNRAKAILEKYNGVLIADGVGLGKTFIGGELIREAAEGRRQRALLICPAALRDGTWRRFGDINQIYIERISYEQFASDVQIVGPSGSRYLSAGLNEYSLIVIDEAQAFRNPGIERAGALRKLLQGSPQKKLVLMSATPVNNSLWDLYYLLSYFIRQDAAFAHKGIVSLRRHFAEGQAQDPTQLKPDHLFDVLDEVTVRRTRNFVKKYYPNDTIDGPDGVKITIKFPRPHVTRIEYDLESMLPGLLDDFEEKVMPETAEPELTLARYAPEQYRRGHPPGPEPSLIGLLRSALLKRLESSPYAFANTLRRMVADHETFLEGLRRGLVLTSDKIHDWQETDNDESLDLLTEDREEASTADYDVPTLTAAVRNDIDILTGFLSVAESVTQEQDTKLQALILSLKDIFKKAQDEGGLEETEVRNKRKVIIFSYFADTVSWVEEHLSNVIQADPDLAAYRGRLINIIGDETKSGVSREQAIFGFAPESTEAPPGSDDDRFDILVSTDVLAEGQNLQQCRNVINYDLPWNPMRLVQRHGRIDRIGSPHDDVYIGCVFPGKELERLLTLEARVRRKLAQAAATIGVESEVIPGGATGEIIFDDKLKDVEALRRGEADLFENAGEDPGAHSGEEYRQELRKGLENRGRIIRNLPWAAGSGFRGGPQEGHFFCCRVGDRLYLRFIPTDGSDVVSNTLECLRHISCSEETPRYISDSLQTSVYDAWNQARDSVYQEWQYLTDPVNLQPRIRPLFRNLVDHLRQYPPSDVTQDDLDRTVEALEAPWGLRIERELRNTFNMPGAEVREKSKLVYEKVKELALEPFIPPEPLPPIDKDEVRLVCWLAVSTVE